MKRKRRKKRNKKKSKEKEYHVFVIEEPSKYSRMISTVLNVLSVLNV